MNLTRSVIIVLVILLLPLLVLDVQTSADASLAIRYYLGCLFSFFFGVAAYYGLR